MAKNERARFQATSIDEEGKKRSEILEIRTHDPDTIKHAEKKLVDKGVLRMERHPVDGRGPVHKPPPKSGHGGKYTWEGPDDYVSNELDSPAALDAGDPNFVDEARDVDREEEEAERIVGEVEVAKVAEERAGVARVEVAVPPTELNA